MITVLINLQDKQRSLLHDVFHNLEIIINGDRNTDVTTENNTGFFFKILNISSAFEHVTENLLHARAADDAPEVEASDAIGRNEAEEREHEEQTTESDRVCCLLETDL